MWHRIGTRGSFLGKVWSPCASKVDDLNIAASETASDLSVQLATQFQRFLFLLCLFLCQLRLFMPDIHAAAPICLLFFGLKTQVNDNYLLEACVCVYGENCTLFGHLYSLGGRWVED